MNNFDLLTFTISTTIATLGLFVALLVWLQSRKDAKLAKEIAVMSVKPYLSISTYKDPPKYTATLENNGLGPAIFDSFKIYLDGDELVDDENQNTVEAAALRLNLSIASHSCISFVSGYAFMASDKVDFFEISLNENTFVTREHLKDQFERLDVVIEYSDIFGNAQKPYDTRGKPRF